MSLPKAIEAYAYHNGTTTKGKEWPCPTCGQKLGLHDGPKGDVPVPGAFCVCAECGAINQYGTDLELVGVNADQLATLPGWFQDELASVSSMIRLARARIPAGRRGEA